jgi:DNA-binding MarR family transcriptional regulator
MTTDKRGTRTAKAPPAPGAARLTPILEEQVFLELQRTAQAGVRWVVEALKPHALTPAQYNVLRILRGARPEPLSAGRIAERMVHDDPDLTRLLDRLEGAGWVARARDARDRRVMSVTITADGLAVVDTATESIRRRLREAMAPVDAKQLESLVTLLRRLHACREVEAGIRNTPR